MCWIKFESDIQVIFEAVDTSLVPRPSLAPIFDCLQYAKTEGKGLLNLTTWFAALSRSASQSSNPIGSDSGSSVIIRNFRWQNFKLRKWYRVHVHIFTSALLTVATYPDRIYISRILFDRRVDWLVFRSLYCNFDVLLCENGSKLPHTSWSVRYTTSKVQWRRNRSGRSGFGRYTF